MYRKIAHITDTRGLNPVSRQFPLVCQLFQYFHFSFSGYKVDSSAVPASVQNEMLRATDSYSTSENGKRVRLRFLPIDRLESHEQNLVEEFLTSFSFLYNSAMTEHTALLGKWRDSFYTAIEKSSEQYDR